METWETELFEEPVGIYPIERWLDDLSDQKFAAFDAAVNHVLKVHGIGLLGTPWLKRVDTGLYEFRIRHSARQIGNMYANAGEEVPSDSEDILLRVFVTFHGAKIVLLLHGYDKGNDDSAKRQQKEINEAKRYLKVWQLQEGRKRKEARKQGADSKPAKARTRRSK